MFNEFLKSIKGGLADQLSANSEIDSGKLSGVTDVVTDTFKDGMLDKVKSGQLNDIVGLLGADDGATSSFAGSLTNNLVGNLISKMGLSKNVSSTIAKIAIPFILEKFGAFAKSKGKTDENGISDLLGDVLKGSVKDKLLGGLGKKFGF